MKDDVDNRSEFVEVILPELLQRLPENLLCCHYEYLVVEQPQKETSIVFLYSLELLSIQKQQDYLYLLGPQQLGK